MKSQKKAKKTHDDIEKNIYNQKYHLQTIKEGKQVGDEWQRGLKNLSGSSPSRTSPNRASPSPERTNQINNLQQRVEHEKKELDNMKAGVGKIREFSPEKTSAARTQAQTYVQDSTVSGVNSSVAPNDFNADDSND